MGQVENLKGKPSRLLNRHSFLRMLGVIAVTSYIVISDSSICAQAAKLRKIQVELEEFPELSELETAEPIWAPYQTEEQVTGDNKLAEVKRRYRPKDGSQHYTRVQTGKASLQSIMRLF